MKNLKTGSYNLLRFLLRLPKHFSLPHLGFPSKVTACGQILGLCLPAPYVYIWYFTQGNPSIQGKARFWYFWRKTLSSRTISSEISRKCYNLPIFFNFFFWDNAIKTQNKFKSITYVSFIIKLQLYVLSYIISILFFLFVPSCLRQDAVGGL